MPHQCTNCGRTFADGSKEMLSGCPDCGGNKFQFRPAGVDDGGNSDPSGDPPDPDPPDRGTFTDAAARAGAAVRDRFSSSGPDADAAESKGSTAESGGSTRVSRRSTAESGESTVESDRSDSEPNPTEWPDPTASSGSDDAPPDSGGEVDAPPDSGGEVDAPPDSGGEVDAEATPSRTNDTADRPGASDTPDRPGTDDTPNDSPSDDDREDRAQADARSGVVSNEELSAAARNVAEPTESPQDGTGSDSPDAEPPPDADGTIVEPSSDDRPDLDELREELNDQFESIKIVNPGQYELNLMELYDRDEYIISLQEDGRYVIEVPDTWRDEE